MSDIGAEQPNGGETQFGQTSQLFTTENYAQPMHSSSSDASGSHSFPEPTIPNHQAGSPSYALAAYENESTYPETGQQSQAYDHTVPQDYALPPGQVPLSLDMGGMTSSFYTPQSPHSPHSPHSLHSSGSSHASHLQHGVGSPHSRNSPNANLSPQIIPHSPQFLSPGPHPTIRRSISAGSSSSWRGHRATISEGSFDPDRPIVNDLPGGRSVSRNRTTGDKPYSRSPSQDTRQGLSIPARGHTRNISSPIPSQSSWNSRDSLPGSISPGSQIATEAMLLASGGRRIHEAKYYCSIEGCGANFTADNSRKRMSFLHYIGDKFSCHIDYLGHEKSHSDEKPYGCRFVDCDQAFKNDTDRKRHERTANKHAGQTLTSPI